MSKIKCQIIESHEVGQCKSNAKLMIHHQKPTYVCIKHYNMFQSVGLIMQPTLITDIKTKSKS